MSIKSISESTPITAALTLALCYVCYWVGSESSALRTRLEAAEQTQQRIAEVVERLAGLAGDHSRRLEHLETATKR